jgi:type VI secretion system protein ImpK
MTPRFSEAIDPVFLQVFDLLERIDQGAAISPIEERRKIDDLLKRADQRLIAEAQQWENGKYLLVAWIDEMLVTAYEWDGQDWWRDNVLEWHVFRTRQCNDRYFVLSNSSRSESLDNPVQLSFLGVVLGFRGLYRDVRLSRDLIKKHQLPNDLDEWAQQFGAATQLAQARWQEKSSNFTDDRNIKTATRILASEYLVWPLAAASILAIACFLILALFGPLKDVIRAL